MEAPRDHGAVGRPHVVQLTGGHSQQSVQGSWRRHTVDATDGIASCRDSVIYAAYCAKLGGQVAIKVYQKGRTSASKLRAIKREAAIMTYLSKKR